MLNIDLAPTIYDLARVPLDRSNFDGFSIVPPVRRAALDKRIKENNDKIVLNQALGSPSLAIY